MPNNELNEVVVHLDRDALDYLGLNNASEAEANTIIRQRLFEAEGVRAENFGASGDVHEQAG